MKTNGRIYQEIVQCSGGDPAVLTLSLLSIPTAY